MLASLDAKSSAPLTWLPAWLAGGSGHVAGPDDIIYPPSYAGYRFPAEIISHAVRLYLGVRGNLAGYRSIDVTEDWRAVFRERQTGKGIVIRFFKIGNHKQLYR
jgi:hypothetical protein